MARDLAMVTRFMNVEKKSLAIANFSSAKFALTDSGAAIPYRGDMIYKLGGPVQGDDFDERNGNSIKITSIQCAMKIEPQTSCVDERNYTILVLQYNGRPDSSDDPVVSTATYDSPLTLQFLDADPDSLVSSYCFRNQEFFKNWRVLKSIRGKLKMSGATNSDAVNFHKFVIKPRMSHWKFASGSGEPIQNPIYFLFMCTSGDSNSNTGVKVSGHSKLYYVDN